MDSLGADGRRFSFSVSDSQSDGSTLWEALADGSHVHPRFPERSQPHAECCGEWTPDGRYFVFTSTRKGFSNLWAVREKPFLFHWRTREAVPLTPSAIPLGGSVLTRNGTRAFVMAKNEGYEFVRYDLKARQFIPQFAPRDARGFWFSEDGL